MDINSKQSIQIPFVEAVLKAKVAHICDSVGYNAITQDSSNILVDIYRRTLSHLARHCKDAANNNRRIEPTTTDLVQAYNFIGISIPELQEYIETVKLPLKINITQDEEQKPSNRIQRDLLVDDLLEAEKKGQSDEQDDGDNNKDMSESGLEEDEKPSVPLLRDTYAEIANKFTNCTPVVADKKIRLGGRILLVANTKLKINAPILPDPVPSTSGAEIKTSRKKKEKGVKNKKTKIEIAETAEVVNTDETPVEKRISPIKQVKGRKGRKAKILKEFALPEKEKKTSRGSKGSRGSKNSRDKEKKVRGNKRTTNIKETIEPIDPVIAEPPPLFPDEVVPSQKPQRKETKGKRKKRASDEFKSAKETPVETKSKKKLKPAITPIDPSVVEPPSFLAILEDKPEELIPEIEEITRRPTPTLPPVKLPKGKKKKKSSNQFAIVTETVTSAADDKEWLCPACGLPDNGDLMVQCDSCEEWYHLACTSLSKPPEDDENWECDICIASRTKAAQRRVNTPVDIIKLKTPEPVVKTPPPPTPPQPVSSGGGGGMLPVPIPQSTQSAPPPPAGSSQDDLCPECNLPDDGTMMIQCDDPFCAKWFHGKCVSLLEEPKEDESWFCKVCVEKQQSAFKRRRRAK